MPIITINPAKKAAIDKATDIANLDFWFQNTLADGFLTAEGWRLGLTDQDVLLLTGNFIMAKEAASMGLPIPPITDKDGVPHEYETIEDMTAAMLSYGQYRASLTAEYKTRLDAINAQYPDQEDQ